MTTLATNPAEATFLAAILADPAEDTHRLVFADWLDENPTCGQCRGTGGAEWHDATMGAVSGPCGECGGSGSLATRNAARAEFIRVQIALARYLSLLAADGSKSSVVADYRRRERELWIAQPHPMPGRPIYPVQPSDCPMAWCDGEERYEFSRGFVSHVTLTAAAFLGGECGECAGRGGQDRYPEGDPTNRLMHGSHWYACPTCNGAGRTEGLAKELFRTHPIERVTLSDREPDDNVHTVQTWSWWVGEIQYGNSYIPKELFDLIEETEVSDWGEFRKTFMDRKAAIAALSDSCVRLGRERAGLPPLTVQAPTGSATITPVQ